MSDEENMAREIASLRASVQKYKKRAELANARADRAEEQARNLKNETVELNGKLSTAKYQLYRALNDLGG